MVVFALVVALILAPAAAFLTLVVSASGSAHVGSGSGRSAFPGRNGDILFATLGPRTDDSELYLIRPDGTHQRRLTHTRGFESAPAWSPDGSRIAYTKNPQSLCSQIYLMQANGTHLRRLMHDRWCYSAPAWSPDGRRIALSRSRRSAGTIPIWTVNVNGTGLRRLTGGYIDADPAWSPDGTTIAFVHWYRATAAIWLMDADGSNPRQLTMPRRGPVNYEEDFMPDWSPNGRWIAFSRKHSPPLTYDIYVIRADGTDLRRLTRRTGSNLSPAWSPNGRQIAFDSDRAAREGDPDIYVMNADGSRQRRLTRGGRLDAQAPAWRPRP